MIRWLAAFAVLAGMTLSSEAGACRIYTPPPPVLWPSAPDIQSADEVVLQVSLIRSSPDQYFLPVPAPGEPEVIVIGCSGSPARFTFRVDKVLAGRFAGEEVDVMLSRDSDLETQGRPAILVGRLRPYHAISARPGETVSPAVVTFLAPRFPPDKP